MILQNANDFIQKAQALEKLTNNKANKEKVVKATERMEKTLLAAEANPSLPVRP